MACAVGLVAFLVRFLLRKREVVSYFASSLAFVWVILSFVAVGQWIMVAGGLQGRLLLPAASGLSLLLIVGWINLFPEKWKQRAAAFPVFGFLLLALATPLMTLAPAYSPPRLLDTEQVPPALIPTSLRIGNAVDLIGYRVEPVAARPNETVKVFLYWRVLRPMQKDYTIFVTLLGRDLLDIGSINSFPGTGNYPTSRWVTGKIVEDIYPVHIDADAEAPVLATISAGWYDHTGHEHLRQVDPEGNETSFIGQLRIIPSAWPGAPSTTVANFADQIRLAGVTIARPDNETINLSLEWVCESEPARDLTIFTHVLDGKGRSLAQKDQPPLKGEYSTSAWRRGEVIRDRVVIPLSLGSTGWSAKNIELGLYDPKTGERLVVLDDRGQAIGDSVLLSMPAE
jgi:hypothetical protein